MKKGTSQTGFWALMLGLVVICFVFIAWSSPSPPPPPHYGRFQLDSWAAPMNNGVLMGALVIDTATGETKTVYSRFVKSENDSIVFTNQLRKTFSQIP